MTVPAKLNGYPILHSESWPDGSAIVLAFREGHPAHRFVVALWHPAFEDSWSTGDYLATLPEAMAAFGLRAERMGRAA